MRDRSPARSCESERSTGRLPRACALLIFTCKPTTMNEITDCRGWRPRHPVRRQAAVRYAEKSAHRGPIFPTGRRGRRPLQMRSFRTMTCLFSAGPSIFTPARIAAGRRGHAARPTGKRQDSPGHKKRTASAALLFHIRTMSDHTCFTRLPTSKMCDSFPVGDADRSPITRVLLVCRQAECATVCQRRLAAENDPWRFRQQSSRVISIQFWYLTSWLPRFLLDQTLLFYTMASCKTCIF